MADSYGETKKFLPPSKRKINEKIALFCYLIFMRKKQKKSSTTRKFSFLGFAIDYNNYYLM